MNRTFARLAVPACLALLSCSSTGAPADDYGPLLTELTEQVILPEHEAFVTGADALESAVQAFVETPEPATLEDAQAAWRTARRSFRVLDALRFGPGYSLHLAERIDASPVDAPGIEALAAASEPPAAAIAKAGGRKKGFLGLELLLFPEADGTAPVLSEDETAPTRRALALAMAHEIASSAQQLNEAWQSNGGGYGVQFEHAGQAASPYRTQRAAVNDLAGGVGAALEFIVRDGLRGPLGKSEGGSPNPELVLTARSDNAVADMRATLDGVSALYERGISALIHGKSADLDRTVVTQLDDSEQKLAEIPAPFSEALVLHTAVVDAAYVATRTLKATWNTEVSSALGASVQISDGDGD